MRTLKALIFVLFFCNGFSTLAAQECNANVEMIALTSYPIRPKDSTGSTSEEGLPIKRSIQRQIADAYLYNDVVDISFNENIAVVSVTVTNESTGEIVYSETHSSPATLSIDLNGESSGNYLIEIEANDTLLIGYFNL
ncbi:MAG: DUF3244 domain-containing protein [Bacteroides sp.]|uniref:DUF3244 domain-containing protein n=1 Tax=Bacteroides sp. TaxID=29523 RepID=UPI0026DF63C2|nr:DUF3244 domain-containing protein [Bacteroides sp.]MDO5420502.1 DUF3244 domain-containing protein [Bacteroides sp.]